MFLKAIVPSRNSQVLSGALRAQLAFYFLTLTALVLVAGCGGGSDDASKQVVLATVGTTDIESGYYEDRLVKLAQEELPRGEDGRTLDMAATEGKRAFLDVLINKELMRMKAEQLGYQNDPQIAGARKSLIAYEANAAQLRSLNEGKVDVISEEELAAFHARLGEERVCSYVITNFEDDAVKAREMAAGGAAWDDVVHEYHDGDPPPSGRYVITVPYGRFNPSFENPIFALDVGEISQPISSNYGFWIVRVDELKEGKKPDLEKTKLQMLDVINNRKGFQVKQDFRQKVREKYKLNLDEDALWICYQALPGEEKIFQDGANEPTKRDELQALDVPAEELDRVFYSFEQDGVVQEFTLADYKEIFDRMNVFERPKRSELLGGLRTKLMQELDRPLLLAEAEATGFFEDPEVLALVDDKVEEMMVTKLYSEVVQYDDFVAPSTIDRFWTEHKTDYDVPETRGGRIVICANAGSADKAHEALAHGRPWKEVLMMYGTDQANKSRAGRVVGIRADVTGPARDALFALELNGISLPFVIEGENHGVVQLDKITPPKEAVLDDFRNAVTKRIQQQRKEDAFQTLLSAWRAEFGVTVYVEKLAGLSSWDELILPEGLVPVVPQS